MTVGADGEGKRNAFAKLAEEDAFTPFVKRWQHSPAMPRSVNRPLINKNYGYVMDLICIKMGALS
jgi:hypothetical protein